MFVRFRVMIAGCALSAAAGRKCAHSVAGKDALIISFGMPAKVSGDGKLSVRV